MNRPYLKSTPTVGGGMRPRVFRRGTARRVPTPTPCLKPRARQKSALESLDGCMV